MRVLMVTDWPGEGGGMETYVELVRDGLRRSGDEVRLLTSSVGAGRDVADYVAYGSRSAVAQSILQIANPLAARVVRRAVAELRPDVAHVSMFEMHLSPSALTALRGVPTVLNLGYYKPICPNGLKLRRDGSICTVRHGAVCRTGGCLSTAHWLRDRPRYARIGRELRGVRRLLACSRWLEQELRADGVPATALTMPVVRPRADFARTPAASPTFVFVGRLAREKGAAALLRAFGRVAARAPTSRLRLVGDGPERDALSRLAAELGVSDRVELTGWVRAADVDRHLEDAWAVVVPSLWAEPFGIVGLEAIVRRIPVVASATGGLAEVVAPGTSGLLVANGDEEGLADALLQVAGGRFRDGVPASVADGVLAEHDADLHVAWLRSVLAEAAS